MLSRREFFIDGGKIALGVAAGVAAISSGGLDLLSKAEAKEKPIFPWRYKQLDLDRVGEIAYNKWYEVFCCQGVTSGLFEPLREKIGEPYTSFPIEALRFGMGGMVGWGLTCGAIIGGAFLIGLVTDKDTAERMITDLVNWYSDTMMPTYKPKTINPKGADFKSLTKSDSPLCHQSVGRWMKKEGAEWDDPKRRDRCARVTGSVAVKTTEILNGWLDSGEYVPVYEPQLKVQKIPLRKDIKIAAQKNCGDCHNPVRVGYRAIKARIF